VLEVTSEHYDNNSATCSSLLTEWSCILETIPLLTSLYVALQTEQRLWDTEKYRINLRRKQIEKLVFVANIKTLEYLEVCIKVVARLWAFK
jgi:hypothetical protein